MSETVNTNEVEQKFSAITILNEPEINVIKGGIYRVYALRTEPSEDGTHSPVGYTSVRPEVFTVRDILSGDLTGETVRCNVIKGLVGGADIYEKVIPTNMPLHGFRTSLAESRAARKIKKSLS